jgi:hypothetical protein
MHSSEKDWTADSTFSAREAWAEALDSGDQARQPFAIILRTIHFRHLRFMLDGDKRLMDNVNEVNSSRAAHC